MIVHRSKFKIAFVITTHVLLRLYRKKILGIVTFGLESEDWSKQRT